MAPKTTFPHDGYLERAGAAKKRIALGWCDAAVTNLSKMILIKEYAKDQQEQFERETRHHRVISTFTSEPSKSTVPPASQC
jgi:hypothetical protein